MYHVKTFNNIASAGLEQFDPSQCSVSGTETDDDAIPLRSDSPLAVARAGSGANATKPDSRSDGKYAINNLDAPVDDRVLNDAAGIPGVVRARIIR